MPDHCDCDECKLHRELIRLIFAMLRADAVASTTKARKWQEGSGESLFRRVMEGENKKAPAVAEAL